MVETDIANCFEAIPHDELMQAVEERVVDRHVLKLLRAMLRAGVMEDGPVRRGVTGTPQGGVISPLLATSTCTGSTGHGPTREHGVLVRYADDLVVMCRTRAEAEAALAALRRSWPSSGWNRRRPRPGSCTWRREARGSTSSASTTAGARPSAPRSSTSRFLARWPSRQAMQHARDRIRELTAPARLLLPVEVIVEDLNRFLRGWAAYFRYGNSARHFDKISDPRADAAGAVHRPSGTNAPGRSAGGWSPSTRRTTSG